MNYLLRQPILSPGGTLLVRSRWTPQPRLKETAGSPRHGALTNSRASTNVTLIILRVMDQRRRAQTWRALFIAPCALRDAHGMGHVLACRGRRVKQVESASPHRHGTIHE